MQDLQLIGVHEDGEHLLLSGADGARFRVRVDEPLKAAIRHDRPRLGQHQSDPAQELRPRDVQALIRAGASAGEAADRAGWSVDKVHRFEGPILAEREHVAGLARLARLRARSGASNSSAPTLSARVTERLKDRGVDSSGISWDSWRAEDGPWTVVLTFVAGERQRQAAWSFDLADRTVSALDDEARWLSEEEQVSKGPIPTPHLASSSPRATRVYDVEAEGGLRAAAAKDQGNQQGRDHDHHSDRHQDKRRDRHDEHPEEPIDLMTAMRERSAARSRRQPGGRRGSAKTPTNVPGAGDHAPDHALPLEDLAYDPDTMPPPPAAHAEPDPRGDDGRPEPEVAAYLSEVAEAGQSNGTVDLLAAEAKVAEAKAALAKAAQTNAKAAQAKAAATPKAVATPAARKAPRKNGRPNVPAWDDIMFGSRPGIDSSS